MLELHYQKGDGEMNKNRTTTEIFSENLRDMLIAKHKTQAKLAKYLNVTEATVSRWTNGVAMPRSAMIDRICLYLNCATEDLTKDHTQVVVPEPAEVLADEIMARPALFQMFMLALKANDETIMKCIEVLKK